MLRTKTPYKSRGSVLRHVDSLPDSARPAIQPRGAEHKQNALTLLSVGDATTADLAACLELTAPYLTQLLGDLELEGRLESRKVGSRKVWSMP